MARSSVIQVALYSKHMDVGRVSFISNKTGEEKAYINFANKFDFSATGENIQAKGGGANAISFEQPKEGEGTFELELMSLELASFANGSVLSKGETKFYNRDEFIVATNDEVVTLSETPVGDAKFYKMQSDKVTKIEELSTAQVTSGKSCTLTGAKKNDIIIATYFTSKEALNFTIKAINELSESCTMVLRCKGKTKVEGSFVDMQLTFPNTSVASENNFSFDAEAVSGFNLNVKILADEDNNMVTWSLIPDII